MYIFFWLIQYCSLLKMSDDITAIINFNQSFKFNGNNSCEGVLHILYDDFR